MSTIKKTRTRSLQHYALDSEQPDTQSSKYLDSELDIDREEPAKNSDPMDIELDFNEAGPSEPVNPEPSRTEAAELAQEDEPAQNSDWRVPIFKYIQHDTIPPTKVLHFA